MVPTPSRILVSVVGAGTLGVGLISYFINGVLIDTQLALASQVLIGPLAGVTLEMQAGLYALGNTFSLTVPNA
jgi:hypothetical protein